MKKNYIYLLITFIGLTISAHSQVNPKNKSITIGGKIGDADSAKYADVAGQMENSVDFLSLYYLENKGFDSIDANYTKSEAVELDTLYFTGKEFYIHQNDTALFINSKTLGGSIGHFTINGVFRADSIVEY